MDRSTRITRYELPLERFRQIIILTPEDITKKEVKKLKGYVDYLETIAQEDKTTSYSPERKLKGHKDGEIS